MKFDVVIPCWNSGELLCRSLQSVLNQSHQDFEVFVVDGSDDEGDKVYFEQTVNGDERFHYIVQDKEAHPYAGGARNQGVALGTASVIAFLDSDDEWYEDHLEQHDMHWEFDEELSMVWSGVEADLQLESMLTGGNVVMRQRACQYMSELPEVPKEHRWLYGAYVFGLCMQPTNYSVSRHAFEDVGGFPSYRYQEDKLLQANLIYAYPHIACIEEVTCYADWHREGKITLLNQDPGMYQDMFVHDTYLSGELLKEYAKEYFSTIEDMQDICIDEMPFEKIMDLCKSHLGVA